MTTPCSPTDQPQDVSEDEVFFGVPSEKELEKAARYRKRRTEYYYPDFRVNRQSLLLQSSGSSIARSFRHDDTNIVYESDDEPDADAQADLEPTEGNSSKEPQQDAESRCLSASFSSSHSSCNGSDLDIEPSGIKDAEDSLIVHQRRSNLAATPCDGSGDPKTSIDDMLIVRESSICISTDDSSRGAPLISESTHDLNTSSSLASFSTAKSDLIPLDSHGIHAHDLVGSPSIENQPTEVCDESAASLVVLSVSEVVNYLEEDRTSGARTSFSDMSGLSPLPTDSSSDQVSLHYLSEYRMSVNKYQLTGTEAVSNNDGCLSNCTEKEGDSSPGLANCNSASDANENQVISSTKIADESAVSITSLEEAQLAKLTEMGQHAWLEQMQRQSSVASPTLAKNLTNAVLDEAAVTMATIKRERLTGSAFSSAGGELWHAAKIGQTSRHSPSSHVTELSNMECDFVEELSVGSTTLSSFDVAAATMATLRGERAASRSGTPKKCNQRSMTSVSSYSSLPTSVANSLYVDSMSISKMLDHTTMAGDSLQASLTDDSSCLSFDVVGATMATLERERLAESQARNVTPGQKGNSQGFSRSGASSAATSASWQTAKSGNTSRFSFAAPKVDVLLSTTSEMMDQSIAERSSNEELTEDGSTLSSLDVVAVTMATLRNERSAGASSSGGTPRKLSKQLASAATSYSSMPYDRLEDRPSMELDSLEASTDGDICTSLDVVTATMEGVRLSGSLSTEYVTCGSSRNGDFRHLSRNGESLTSSLATSSIGTCDTKLTAVDDSLPIGFDFTTPDVVAATMATIRMERLGNSSFRIDPPRLLETKRAEDGRTSEGEMRNSISSMASSSHCGVISEVPSEVVRESVILAGHLEDARSATESSSNNDDIGFLPPTFSHDQDDLSFQSNGSRIPHNYHLNGGASLPLPVDTFDGDASSCGAKEFSIADNQLLHGDVRKSFATHEDADVPRCNSRDPCPGHVVNQSSTTPPLNLTQSTHRTDTTSVYESCDNSSDDLSSMNERSSYNPYLSCSSAAAGGEEEAEEDEMLSSDIAPLRRPRSSTPRKPVEIPSSSRFELSSSGTPVGVRCEMVASPKLLQPRWTKEISDVDISLALKETSCQTSFKVPSAAGGCQETSSQTSFQAWSGEDGSHEISCQTSFRVPHVEANLTEMSCQTSFFVAPPSADGSLLSGTTDSTLDASTCSEDVAGALHATPATKVVASPRDAFKMPFGRAAKSPAAGRPNTRAVATPSPTFTPHLLKPGRYNNIVSPVGKYINENPAPPLITNVKQTVGRSKLPVSIEKRTKIPLRAGTVQGVSPSVLTPLASPNFVRPSQPPTRIDQKDRLTRARSFKENVAVKSNVPASPSRCTNKSSGGRDTLSDSSGLLLEQSILDTFGMTKEELDKIGNSKLRRDVISHVRKELTRKEKAAIEQAKLVARQSNAPVLPYAIYEEPAALASVQKEWDLVTKLHTVKNSKLPVPSPRPIVMKHTGDRKKLQWSNTLLATPEVFSSPSRPIRSAPPTILIKLPDGVQQVGVGPGNSNEGVVDVSMVEVHRSPPTYTGIKGKRVAHN